MGSPILIFGLLATIIGATSAAIDLKIEPDVGRHMTVAENSKLELTCVVTKQGDAATLTWDVPGMVRNLGPSDKQDTLLPAETNSDGTTTLRRVLTLHRFTERYNGQYKCTAAEGGSSEDRMVEVKAVKETKTEGDDALYNYGDKKVSLSCVTSLGTDAQLEGWYKHNASIEAGEKYEILENGTLVIDTLDRDDAGQYTAKYKVKTTGATHSCVVHYRAEPLILDMKKSVNREEGQDVEIECDVKGWPRAEVTWHKGEVELVASDRVSFLEHGSFANATMRISDLEYDDEGIYTCRAHSDAFNKSTEKSIKLRVKDKLAWLWPFLGIVAELVVLVLLILFFEKIKKKNDDHPHAQ